MNENFHRAKQKGLPRNEAVRFLILYAIFFLATLSFYDLHLSPCGQHKAGSRPVVLYATTL